jgi:hypothetical protein
LKIALQRWRDGWIPLKIRSFLTDQILQHIVIRISIANGQCNWTLNMTIVAYWSSNWGTSKPKLAQQICAKGQMRNRCVTVSSIGNVAQKTQLYLPKPYSSFSKVV